MPDQVAGPSVERERVAEQRDPERVPLHGVPGGGEDGERGVDHPIDHQLNATRNRRRQRTGGRFRRPTEAVEQLTLTSRKPQRACERRENLDRRGARPTLFEAHEIVDRDAYQQRELFAPQAGHPPVAADGKACVCGCHPVTPGP